MTRTVNNVVIMSVLVIISPPAFAISKITAPIVPDPAIKGVAKGNTYISFLDSASFSSAFMVEVPPDERANTMSMLMSSNKIPPAILNYEIDMPRNNKKISPSKAKYNNIATS